MTKEELLEEINKVKNATEKGENTALRIGNILENLAELCLDKDDSCVYVCVSDTAVLYDEVGDTKIYDFVYEVKDEENLERNRKAYNIIKKKMENKEGVSLYLSYIEGLLKARELSNSPLIDSESNYIEGRYNTHIMDVVVEEHYKNEDNFKDYADIIEANLGATAFSIRSELSGSDFLILLPTGHILNSYWD